MRNETNLVSGADWDFLLGVVSTRADVNQVDPNLLHLRGKDLALFDTPGEPVAAFVLFISRPLCSAYPDEERLIGPRLADPPDQLERPTHAVLQALTAILVGPVVGKRGKK